MSSFFEKVCAKQGSTYSVDLSGNDSLICYNFLLSYFRYGIPINVLPESSLDTRNHCAYWKKQLQRERQNQDQSFNPEVDDPLNNRSDYQESREVIVPCPMDVIFGRGKSGKLLGS